MLATHADLNGRIGEERLESWGERHRTSRERVSGILMLLPCSCPSHSSSHCSFLHQSFFKHRSRIIRIYFEYSSLTQSLLGRQRLTPDEPHCHQVVHNLSSIGLGSRATFSMPICQTPAPETLIFASGKQRLSLAPRGSPLMIFGPPSIVASLRAKGPCRDSFFLFGRQCESYVRLRTRVGDTDDILLLE